MRVPFVDLKRQYENHRESLDGAIAAVIEETAFIRGKYVKAFEDEFASAMGVEHCVSCANGTDALYLGLRMLEMEPGDEVITTANSWIATSESITNAGGVVVFVDTDDATFNMDVKKIEEKITKRTRAILPVHLLGQSADMTAIMDLAGRHGLAVIEDCAQAHKATWGGQKVGTFGSVGTFSFYPGKNLGAFGDAGAIITNDGELARRMRTLANHGAEAGSKHSHIVEGINSRLDGIQASVLSAKLPHLGDWTKGRREAAAKYGSELSTVSEVRVPVIAEEAESVFHVYSILADDRDGLQEYLSDEGIATSRHYPTPLPFLEAYRYLGHTREEFPTASRHQERMLSLPIYPEITDEQIGYIAERIGKYYKR
ncbi:MAG: DegT/DnrJ/EryC1/StrS family aminotransferase [Verrucomicrobiota bacterium]